MSREDTHKPRHPWAAEAEKHFRQKDADAGQISRTDSRGDDDYSFKSDSQLINDYVREQREKDYWSDDTRH